MIARWLDAVGMALDSGGYGLTAFLAHVETSRPLRAAGRGRPVPSRGTAPPERLPE